MKHNDEAKENEIQKISNIKKVLKKYLLKLISSKIYDCSIISPNTVSQHFQCQVFLLLVSRHTATAVVNHLEPGSI